MFKESTKANDKLKKNVTSKTMAHKIKCQNLWSSYLNNKIKECAK